ncbi:hypothetical protein WMY93_019033 [Mugilogobius chulae]|uniref:Granulins domain-containing protein n=1 Tax=Mugilogobius chulae TaxID=88201 RepID=A0AAW0NNE7_9GOBI
MLHALVFVGLCGLVSASVTCPDGQMKCKDLATCCLTEKGYRCCPYPQAVCCEDQAHCCPSGYTCNSLTQMCERHWGGQSHAALRAGSSRDAPLPLWCTAITTSPVPTDTPAADIPKEAGPAACTPRLAAVWTAITAVPGVTTATTPTLTVSETECPSPSAPDAPSCRLNTRASLPWSLLFVKVE